MMIINKNTLVVALKATMFIANYLPPTAPVMIVVALLRVALVIAGVDIDNMELNEIPKTLTNALSSLRTNDKEQADLFKQVKAMSTTDAVNIIRSSSELVQKEAQTLYTWLLQQIDKFLPAAEPALVAGVKTAEKDEKTIAAIEEKKDEKATAKTKNNAGVLKGVFSVAENKKVHFSMGNLQFNPKKYEFRFAEHQWDCVGENNNNISPNYNGWIDLFGYGTSGYMGCEPTKTDCESNRYQQTDIANTKYDWGVYNPISNGGNKEGLWRTLTADEWDYLFSKRPNADKLRAQACVNGINGVVLLPDNFYEHQVRVPFDNMPDGFSGNSYDLDQWTLLADAGAVFLPCAGARGVSEGKKWENDGCMGSYWSATIDNQPDGSNPTDGAKYCHITDGKTNCSRKSAGYAVRLVQDIKTSIFSPNMIHTRKIITSIGKG